MMGSNKDETEESDMNNTDGDEADSEGDAVDRGMIAYEKMVKSLTNRGKNKRQVRLVEDKVIQFAFAGSDTDEDDEDFVVDQDRSSDASDDGKQKVRFVLWNTCSEV